MSVLLIAFVVLAIGCLPNRWIGFATVKSTAFTIRAAVVAFVVLGLAVAFRPDLVAWAPTSWEGLATRFAELRALPAPYWYLATASVVAPIGIAVANLFDFAGDLGVHKGRVKRRTSRRRPSNGEAKQRHRSKSEQSLASTLVDVTSGPTGPTTKRKIGDLN